MQSRPEHSEHNAPRPQHGGQRQLLLVSEVVARTGLSKWTIYRRIKSGEWPSGRSGRSHLIPRAFVEGLVAEIENGRQVDAETYAATTWHGPSREEAA